MTSLTLPYAARAAGLVGSVIDSSTSLLHKQTHDVVRFAMGSPGGRGGAVGDLGRDRGGRTRRAARLRLRRHRGRSAVARGATGDVARHQRRDHRGPVDHHRRRHAGPRPVLQDLRGPRRPRRRSSPRPTPTAARPHSRTAPPCWRSRSTTTAWTSTHWRNWSRPRAAHPRPSTRSRPSRTRPA